MLIKEKDGTTIQETTPEKSNNVYHFEKLAPIDDANISIYEDAINFVFDNQDIKNIAISGAYGSGKSSVLASYKKKHPEKKFIHISLAHFEPNKKGNEVHSDKASTDKEAFDSTETYNGELVADHSNESVLEGKILNQLIHQIKEQDIPQTHFRIKNSLYKEQIYKYTIAIILFFISIVHLTFSYTWINFVETFPEKSILKSILALTTTPFSFFLSGCIGLIIISFYVYSSVRKQRFRATIRKLSLQGNDIELFENNTDSFFDKYLNEVLYLFENSGVDGIVFEDMDRYELEGIFERLREVNTLANIRLNSKRKPIIRFFFLLRDDLFISKDRTKFFDYIIPVVPVVDSSNSYDQLIGHMKKNGFYDQFKDGFLQGLSLYIDDMRLLKNICNEFLIYYNRLKATELDLDKMLAIITYKNIFPRDFSQLQINQGFVHALFANKDIFICDKKVLLQNKLKEIEAKIEAANKEHLLSLREIDAAIIDRRFGNYSLHNLGDAQLTDWIKQQLSGKALKEYEERRNFLATKLSSGISEWEKQKEELRLEIQKLNQKKLAEVIDRDNIDKIFSITSKNALDEETDYQDVKRNQYFNLLKYLIRNGYIDESYADYMTYFYPNSLTTSDKVFLQSVTNKVAKDYYYELKKPALVFSKLNTRDFDEEETLNFSLLSYMLKNPDAQDCLQHLISQIRNNNRFEFVSQYFEATSERAAFVRCINAQWPEFFSIALENHSIPKKQIWDYSHETLVFSPEADIVKVNTEGCLEHYIASQSNYLNIDSIDIDALVRALILLNVKFESIDYPDVNHLLFRQVYENSLYVLNFENIFIMLLFEYGIEDPEEIRHKSYSYITAKRDTALCRYVQAEINIYMDAMLEFGGESILDSESAALDLLNNQGISSKQKHQYISKLDSEITALKDVRDSSLWKDLLEERLIVFSEQNLIDYWLQIESFDEALVDFVNNSGQCISLHMLKEYDDDIQSKMFNQIIKCTNIKSEQYIQMLNSLNRYYGKGFSITGIPDEKIKLLFDNNIIRMTENNLKDIRANYPNAVYYFINVKLDEYINIMTTQLLVHEEVLEILSWDVADEKKLALLKLSTSPISLVHKNYTPQVAQYILENRLEPKDIPILYADFHTQTTVIQTFVVSYAETRIDSIIDGKLKTSDELKFKLLASYHVNEDKKYKLLLIMLPYISKNDCKKCFELIGMAEFSKIFETYAKPRILKTEQNQGTLDALISRGWLYDYRDSPYDGNYYIVRRKGPKKKRASE